MKLDETSDLTYDNTDLDTVSLDSILSLRGVDGLAMIGVGSRQILVNAYDPALYEVPEF